MFLMYNKITIHNRKNSSVTLNSVIKFFNQTCDLINEQFAIGKEIQPNKTAFREDNNKKRKRYSNWSVKLVRYT